MIRTEDDPADGIVWDEGPEDTMDPETLALVVECMEVEGQVIALLVAHDEREAMAARTHLHPPFALTERMVCENDLLNVACQLVDIQAERAINHAEIEIRVEKRLLAMQESWQREDDELEAEARQQE